MVTQSSNSTKSMEAWKNVIISTSLCLFFQFDGNQLGIISRTSMYSGVASLTAHLLIPPSSLCLLFGKSNVSRLPIINDFISRGGRNYQGFPKPGKTHFRENYITGKQAVTVHAGIGANWNCTSNIVYLLFEVLLFEWAYHTSATHYTRRIFKRHQ